jgi:hypothetical protein
MPLRGMPPFQCQSSEWHHMNIHTNTHTHTHGAPLQPPTGLCLFALFVVMDKLYPKMSHVKPSCRHSPASTGGGYSLDSAGMMRIKLYQMVNTPPTAYAPPIDVELVCRNASSWFEAN